MGCEENQPQLTLHHWSQEGGVEVLLSILTWGLLWSQLKASSLKVIGKLGLSVLEDLVEIALRGRAVAAVTGTGLTGHRVASHRG